MERHRLEPLPEKEEERGHHRLWNGGQHPGKRERAERPDKDAVRIVLFQMIDLGDEPDAGTEEHRAEDVERLAKRRALHHQGRAVARHERSEDDRELCELGHGTPVEGEEEDDAEPDEDAPGRAEDDAAPGQAFFGGRIARPDRLGVMVLDDPFVHPRVKLVEQPADTFVHEDPLVAEAWRSDSESR